MGQVIAILKVFMLLLPLIKEAVNVVEQALPVNGVGQQKLEMVKGMVEEAFKLGNEAQVSFEQVWPMVQNLITALVAASNATGLFKRQQ